VWEREAGGAVEIGRAHGIENQEIFVNSPIKAIMGGAAPIRRRLCDPGCPRDYPILQNLADRGLTDYAVYGLVFSGGQTNVVTLASRAEAGFSELELATLVETLPYLGMLLELGQLHLTARRLMETYLGRRSGAAVLSGGIKRGDGRLIHAVLWSCDLRGFTEFSETEDLDNVIDYLNSYFEAMGAAIEAHGGEILKFMGDGMLAIFPIAEGTEEDACRQALTAAGEALEAFGRLGEEQRAAGKSAPDCGIALHLGDVMYGNIGTARRLDFTVIGPAVNLVSRIEAFSRNLDPPVVCSTAFARSCGKPLRSLGAHKLKGIGENQEIFTLDAAFDHGA
jgi:adenylate cyclase